ncbi:MAG: divergent polysaccharide deacetylase family protein [Candidatus Omnitrophica bacterium]|jgi:hypothetical protein|nr:divergent polysaccharide deacetylase family protein [Candidatus Omnitrophota bacterium]
MKRNKLKTIIIVLAGLMIAEGIVIICLLLARPKKPVITVRPIQGRIAIVIDDWGYHQDTLGIASQIHYPLTAAVLPGGTHSRDVAKKLHDMGLEIILHLPMEPFEEYGLEKNTILASMNEGKIVKIISDDLAKVKLCKGVSNHMGSKLTSDPKAMAVVFKELKKRKLYFLDSLVTANSVCADLAKKMQLKFARRDIFLDNTEEPEYIRLQIAKLKKKAIVYGRAIGICHDRRITLQVLKEVMPEIAREGFKFVFVSELVR